MAFNDITFADQAFLVNLEGDISDYLAAGADYSFQLSEARKELKRHVREHGFDPDTHVIDVSGSNAVSQLRLLHGYITLRNIYRDLTRKIDDHFAMKRKIYKEKAEEEVRIVFEVDGLDADLDESDTIAEDEQNTVRLGFIHNIEPTN